SNPGFPEIETVHTGMVALRIRPQYGEYRSNNQNSKELKWQILTHQMNGGALRFRASAMPSLRLTTPERSRSRIQWQSRLPAGHKTRRQGGHSEAGSRSSMNSPAEPSRTRS